VGVSVFNKKIRVMQKIMITQYVMTDLTKFLKPNNQTLYGHGADEAAGDRFG